MTELFNFRYRIPTTRAKWWDYGKNGAYFITICTSRRVHYFGEIKNKKMILTDIGHHAWDCWMKIPDHFPFVKLDAFVVMPNHVHGIIIVEKPSPGDTVDGNAIVEMQNIASLRPMNNHNQYRKTKNQFGPQSQNLASIIRGFKIGVTIFCIRNKIPFRWQPRYHDHIIRDKQEFERIRNYILKNPSNWKENIYNPIR